MRHRAHDPDRTRWARIEELCFGALGLPAAERDTYLSARCGGDDALRREVEAILRASDARPNFLKRPILKIPPDGAYDGEGVSSEDQTWGAFRLIRPLGRGGMGEVHLAMLEGDGFSRPVAVKVLRRGFDTDQILHRFREERRILAALNHPNIAALVNGGATSDGRPYVVMEFVDGVPIDEYCERMGLSATARLRLFHSVCSAVDHAHRNLVVHRDIKPGNVLVTHDGVPKLLDFGIGALLDEGEPTAPAERGATAAAGGAMTPTYAAPEQRTGGRITTATDVYGLGVLLYRLVAGCLPFSGLEDGRPGHPSFRERVPAPPTLRSRAVGPRSGELDAIVLKCLEPKPDDRYGSVAALAEDVERFLGGRPVRAIGDGPLYRARKFASRNRIAVSSAIVAFAVLVGGFVSTGQHARRLAVERDRALEVRGFLLEAFGATGPEAPSGDPVTARALLDGQASALEVGTPIDPTLRAQMMIVLAEGYERLGLYTEAEAWAERVAASGPEVENTERVAGLAMVGWIAHQQGRSAEARDLLREAVAAAGRTRGAERTLARALNDLGVVQEAMGDYEAARSSHESSLAVRTEMLGPLHRSVGVSASNLAAIHYRLGDLAGATREGRRALEILRGALGADHQRAIIAQGNLAVFRLVEGDVAGAEEEYRDLLERQSRIQGRSHPVTVGVMVSLASVLRRTERWDEAESLLREALEIERARDPINGVREAWTMATLGDVVSSRGGHEEAVTLIRDALDTQLAALGPDHVDVAQSQNYLSVAYERADSLGPAIRWQAAAVATLRAGLGPTHPQTESEGRRLEDLRARPRSPGR